VHQVGISLHEYIDMHGQQNIEIEDKLFMRFTSAQQWKVPKLREHAAAARRSCSQSSGGEVN
jgi:hypothetical protein